MYIRKQHTKGPAKTQAGRAQEIPNTTSTTTTKTDDNTTPTTRKHKSNKQNHTHQTTNHQTSTKPTTTVNAKIREQISDTFATAPGGSGFRCLINQSMTN